jgi:hypothetical protein
MFSTTPPGSLLVIVFSVILLITGIGVMSYLFFLLFSAILASFGGLLEQAAFRRYSARCERGDALLEKGDLTGAVRAFAEAFFLKPVRRDSALLSDIANYHTGLLSRLLTVADELGKGRARLLSLADTDRLLAERLELQLEYFRTVKRGENQGLRDIEQRLRDNETRVRAAVHRLVDEIRSSEERVLYH